MARAKKPTATKVEAIRHKDKRVNIPTEELRDFVAEDEAAPKKMLYPRDPSLDPQLVWKGKDEQDAADLEVPVVPIYIQEKIHPQAIIEDLRDHPASKGDAVAEPDATYQPDLFGDFNGLPEEFDQRVDFYQHEANWQNRMILGDSLLVMNSLAEKEGLKGKVQMIYIDPPYGIKFGSNWQVSTRKRDVKDGRATDASRQPEQIRAFRDTWKLGIHSYLAYLRDRLVVARELLTETGSVFVQIGDENVHLVRCLLDEVFGSENFSGLIWFRKKTMPLGARYLERMGDYIIWYAKDADQMKFRRLFATLDFSNDFHWNWRELNNGKRIKLGKSDLEDELKKRTGEPIRLVSMWPPEYRDKDHYSVSFRGKEWWPPKRQCYPTTIDKIRNLVRANRIEIEGQYLRYIMKASDCSLTKINLTWTDTIGARDQNYVVETNPVIVQRCMLLTTDPGDLVLDPTCGSGTTAYVAEQWGRRWITVDTSRVALALARTRLMAAKYPYYLLADSSEGVEKEAEITGLVPPEHKTFGDIRKGFVYRRVPHITLKSIANNEEIDVIHAKWQQTLEPLQAELNRLLNESWEEWEIPREAKDAWPDAAKQAHQKWWEARRKRQREIDDSIARRAESETLYDQPYEDKKRLRVTGPFTVESLSPHRVLSPADANMDGTVSEQEAERQQDFASMILDNLKKAGVQNTIKNERLKFDRLEPYAGTWIQAEGEYTEADGTVQRVAVSIGPEHGTVGPEQVKEAAKEAVQGVGFDLLIVCGFAFDPHVSEEARRYGKLTVLPARMNPDLAMGEELLKKTGAGNLFMVFGEPDVEIHPQDDGRIVAEIKGVDVYDPTTGEIRSSSTDDIACWFIDTDYNGESFFVRHAYFTGAGDPYKKLKRALRAEIDEAAWSSLYSTTSRPFPRPKTGKFAIKVINHYGDEVLKVFSV